MTALKLLAEKVMLRIRLMSSGAMAVSTLSIRSTGLGWASGVGRIGAIVGPTLGGVLLAQELPLQQNFLIFAVPAALSALAMLVFAVNAARRTATVTAVATA